MSDTVSHRTLTALELQPTDEFGISKVKAFKSSPGLFRRRPLDFGPATLKEAAPSELTEEDSSQKVESEGQQELGPFLGLREAETSELKVEESSQKVESEGQPELGPGASTDSGSLTNERHGGVKEGFKETSDNPAVRTGRRRQKSTPHSRTSRTSMFVFLFKKIGLIFFLKN
jgi:hypothetical protein